MKNQAGVPPRAGRGARARTGPGPGVVRPSAAASLPNRFETPQGGYSIRTATHADEAALRRMLERAPPEDIRLRFFRYVRHFPREFIEPLTRMDQERHFACVAVPDGRPDEVAGSAMLVTEPGTTRAEFGILVAREHAGRRLGSHLMRCLLGQARDHGLGEVYGTILAENANMIDLARRLGFRIRPDPNDAACVHAEVRLAPPRPVRPPAAAT